MQKLILVAQALYRKRCGNRLSKIQKVRRRFLIGSGCFRCKAEAWRKRWGDRYRSRATEKIVNLRCRFGGYVAYRVCPQVSLSLGLRQGVYCLRRYLRRLSLCKFRRRAVCVVDKRSVGSRSVAAGRRSPHSAAIFGRACPLCPAAFSTSLRGAFSRLVQFGRRWFAPSKYCLGF